MSGDLSGNYNNEMHGYPYIAPPYLFKRCWFSLMVNPTTISMAKEFNSQAHNAEVKVKGSQSPTGRFACGYRNREQIS